MMSRLHVGVSQEEVDASMEAAPYPSQAQIDSAKTASVQQGENFPAEQPFQDGYVPVRVDPVPEAMVEDDAAKEATASKPKAAYKTRAVKH